MHLGGYGRSPGVLGALCHGRSPLPCPVPQFLRLQNETGNVE